jgi:hypothetical protein
LDDGIVDTLVLVSPGDADTSRLTLGTRILRCLLNLLKSDITPITANGSISALPTIRSELCRKTSFGANDLGE